VIAEQILMVDPAKTSLLSLGKSGKKSNQSIESPAMLGVMADASKSCWKKFMIQMCLSATVEEQVMVKMGQ